MNRRVIAAVLTVLALIAGRTAVARQWDAAIVCASCDEWNAPQEPFRLFGNTYYVGTAGLAAMLVDTGSGLILLDGGLPQTAPLIDTSIRKLGFRTEDIRLITASHEHYDHAGGIAALQRMSGATVAASARAALALQSGLPAADDPQFAVDPPRYPAVRNVRVVSDGETLRVGTVGLTAHLTPGHTPGSTTWTWRDCQGNRCLTIVYADSLNPVSADAFRFTGDAQRPSIASSFRASIARVETLACDIIVSVHPGFTGVAARLKQRLSLAPGEPDPFVDPDGCRNYAANFRKQLEDRIAREQNGR